MSRSRPRRANSSRAIAYDGSSATCRPTSRTSAGLLPSWMPSTPNSAYTPPPSRPRPLAFLDRAAGAQYSVVTHNNRPPNRRTFNGRFWGERSFRGAWSITFFSQPRRNQPLPWLGPTRQRRLDRPGLERSDEYELPDQQTSQDGPATRQPSVSVGPSTVAATAAALRQRSSPSPQRLLRDALPYATCHPCGANCLRKAYSIHGCSDGPFSGIDPMLLPTPGTPRSRTPRGWTLRPGRSARRQKSLRLARPPSESKRSPPRCSVSRLFFLRVCALSSHTASGRKAL